uniref:Pyridine nucleotide-disulfide oxidoreductase n=1 Tax=uncultured bacterium Contig1450 TaxID=1393427 RepID=W0FKX6_9BACT|nr:pyridine nucleotide-disulfide oxidoreductase [uncultured bacterium Contig1450]
MKQYVIIGNGVAATGCIEGIRSVDSEEPITVVSEENHEVYCRPLISYYLEKKTDLKRMHYRDEAFYERMGCKVLYGKKAVSIDKEKKEALLDDGTVLPYTSLCLATGSSPFLPSFEGLDTVQEKYSFLTLDDALALEEAISETSRVLIIGAGLIGLKCAEGICERVASVTVCDLADRVLSSILDDDAAAIVQKHLEAHGLSFLLGDSVAHFDKGTAQMNSGITVDFDVLVLAIGVRANIALVKDAGGEVNRGVRIDSHMQTSLEDIYAAGDCTEGMDISSGEAKVLAILPNAVLQGYTAGQNMAGKDVTFEKGIPMNSIGFFGLHIMTAGTYEGDVYEEITEDSLKRIYTKDDLLKGFMLIGLEERAGILTSMIREKTPLSSVNFEIMKKVATTAAFPADIRRKKFGGVV